MKGKYELLYTQLEKAKFVYDGKLTGIISFCQSCLSNDKLQFLPDEVETIDSRVVFSYEEDTNDHLMITFRTEPASEYSKCIDYFLFQNDHIISENGKSWLEIRKIINDFGKSKMIKETD